MPYKNFISFTDLGRVNQQEINYEDKFLQNSSETPCEITFQFEEYIKYKPQQKYTINKKFLEWFIGFVEGDGSFIISKNKIYFDITQNLQDVQVLYYIKKELGFGKILIRNEPKRNVAVFYVTSEDNFYRLIKIFNGNLCTRYKKEQFYRWLITFNNQYKKDIKFNDRIVRPSLKTSWLSGFIDAEGCFIARVKNCKTSKLKKAPHLCFSITQKQPDILIIIRYLFLGKTEKNIRHDKSWNGWELHISSFKKLILIRKYINSSKLKTKKHISYLRWCKIHDMILNKEHLNPIGLDKITLLSTKVNNHLES